MDGLASIVGLSTCAMIALIAWDSGHAHVSLLAICFSGAIVGFLCYNLPPASIYLGDSGSMVIGLFVGVLAMQGAMKSSTTLSLFVPVVIMTVPLLDTTLAIVRRKLSGSSFDVADRGHIHHCLLRRGLTVWQSLWIIGSLCVVTGAVAAAASILHVEAIAWIAVVAVVSILIRTRAFGYHELSLVKLASANVLARVARRLAESTGMHPQAVSIDPNAPAFDAAWQKLISEAERLDATALELRRARESDNQLLYRWSRDDSTAQPLPTWQYTLRTEATPNATIELEACGTNADTAQGWNQLQLNRLLQRFHRDWGTRAVVLAEEAAMRQTNDTNVQVVDPVDQGIGQLQKAA